jgi:pimeloyl-ACP methyl ester carboxylesterase
VRRAVTGVLAVVGLAAISCAGPDRPELSMRPPVSEPEPTSTVAAPSTTALPTTTVPPTTTTLPSAPEPTIAWEGCGEGLECGTLTVPLDYDDPTKGTVDLFVQRRPARDEDNRIGTLFVNPGGPGVAGTVLVEQASFYFSDELLERFDIVGWDPRGTGRSSPVDCVDDLDPFLVSTDPTPDSPEEVQQLAAVDAVLLAGCSARSGSLLPYVSTQATARDIDSLRRALGEDQVSYFGFSYGSALGATWATLFPQTVRAAVLDGTVNLNAGWEADETAQAAGLERGLLTALQSCAADPGCPFYSDGDPAGAYEALAAALDASPLPGPPGRPPANPRVLFYATVAALNDTSNWNDLYRALADARDGNADRLYVLYDGYVRRAADGTFSNVIEAYLAIGCLDLPAPDPAEFPAIDARIRRAAPHMGVGFAYPYACSQWPARLSTPPLRLTAAGVGPVLVVGTTGDAITPIESSRALADDLEDGILLTVDGFRHTGYGVNRCSIDVVDRYLVDLTVPAEGTVCA